MPLYMRKKTILAKIESTYGTDSAPTGAANAILAKNIDVTPISADLVDRNLQYSYYGSSGQLMAQKFVSLSFEVEAQGFGTYGAAPAYDALLRACAFAKAQTTSAVTITRVGSTATATLASHGLVNGDKVTISGASDGLYNGSFTIANVTTNTFDYTMSGTPAASPATGSPVLLTGTTYTPVSSAFESVSIYFQLDTVLHKATGCMGNVELNMSVKQIPTFKFSFTGIYNAPSDAAAPTVDYTQFQVPYIANTQNTPSYSLFGFSSGGLENFSLNMQNNVIYKTLIGSEKVLITGRNAQGSLQFEAPSIATKDFFSLVAANTTGAFALSHGNKNGFKINLSAPKVLLGNPAYADSDGVAMLNAPFSLIPNAGNDELVITYK